MSRDPVLIAYGSAKTRKGARIWKRVGATYPHEEGSGLTVVLDLIPFDGRIVLLEREPGDDDWLAKRAGAETGRMGRGRTSR